MNSDESDKQLPVSDPQGTDAEMLGNLLRETFDYFLKETSPETGLIADKTETNSPSSITAIGFGLSSFVVAVERGLLSRKEAITKH